MQNEISKIQKNTQPPSADQASIERILETYFNEIPSKELDTALFDMLDAYIQQDTGSEVSRLELSDKLFQVRKTANLLRELETIINQNNKEASLCA